MPRKAREADTCGPIQLMKTSVCLCVLLTYLLTSCPSPRTHVCLIYPPRRLTVAQNEEFLVFDCCTNEEFDCCRPLIAQVFQDLEILKDHVLQDVTQSCKIRSCKGAPTHGSRAPHPPPGPSALTPAGSHASPHPQKQSLRSLTLCALNLCTSSPIPNRRPEPI